jgi:hypothetical protein
VLIRECRIAARAVGFSVPCPTRVVTASGQPVACGPSPRQVRLPSCVGLEHDFFLEWNGFDVPKNFAGVDGKPIGHVIIHASLMRDSPSRPCVSGVVIGTFGVLGSTSAIYRCPPDSPLVERSARRGQGGYTSHVLLDLHRNGIEYLVSSHGYGTASVTLMKSLAASLTLITP